MEEIWYSIIGDIEQKTLTDFVDSVNEQVYKSPVKKLKLFLSSEGGDVETSLALYHFIQALPFETEIIGFNKIASSAVIVFVASTKRFVTKNCIFILHEGTTTISHKTATLHQHEDTILWSKERTERHIIVLSKETDKSRGDIEYAMKQTTIFSAQEAKAFGLVKGILEKLPICQMNVANEEEDK